MTSLLSQILNNGEFINQKQIGPKSWLIEDKNGKKFVLNKYYNKNEKAKNSFVINNRLFSNSTNNQSNTHFIFYEDMKIIDVYYFIRIEYCREGDLNRYLVENKYKFKSDSDQQIKSWIIHLLRAIEFLNKNNILHKKLSTYCILIHNGQLKIDGLEHAQKVDPKCSIVNVDINENYGMFNCPELVKKGKINLKYHIWCLGWIIYEIITCDWQHFRLFNEKFDNWDVPNLQENLSKSINNLFKKMISLSPTKRSNPEKLADLAMEYFKTEKIIRRKDDVSDSLDFKEAFLKTFEKRFSKDFKNEDDDNYLTDSDDEKNASKSDNELEYSEKFDEKNKILNGIFNEYKIKELIDKNESYCDFLAQLAKRKRRKFIRMVYYKNTAALKQDLDNFSYLLKYLKERKNPYIVLIDEYFIVDNHKLCWSTEYFEDGSMEKLIKKLVNERRHLSEDKIFDYIYYLFDAVVFLNENKIIHKDIQPKNIYLRNEKLKLGNFGVDHLIQASLKNVKNNLDKPCYLSPELIRSERPDQMSDVWSLGCIMFELFNLKQLFLNKNLINILENNKIPDDLPEIECRAKYKDLFISLIKPASERATAKQILSQLKEMIDKEREMFENMISSSEYD